MVNSNNDYSLKEVIEQLVKAYGIGQKLDEAALLNAWDSVVGKLFARHTLNLSIKNRVLYVKMDSSVIRNELMMARSKLVDLLNKEAGKTVIDDIVFR
jgi:predicted nucleic acid-binding Zn ribbon protein